MKTKLHLLPAVLAASVPVALAAEFAGLHLPQGLDTLSVFSALLVTLLGFTVAGDYARPRLLAAAPMAAPREKADHPLAA